MRTTIAGTCRRLACLVVSVAFLGVGASPALAGKIGGRVVAAGSGAPLSGVAIRVLAADGSQVALATTNASGNYETAGALATGVYYVRTSGGAAGYLDEAYDDIVCPALNCLSTTGTPVQVTSGVTRTGIDFALSMGGRIAGTVTDAVTHSALVGVGIRVYSETGSMLSSTVTDASGAYLTTTGLATGRYRVQATNTAGYVNEAFADIPCVGCSTTTGVLLDVTAGATVAGIDFALSPGGRISGTVTNQAMTPLAGIYVDILTTTGGLVTTATTNASGDYLSPAGLTAGNYRIRTAGASAYLNEAFDDVPCTNCNTQIGSLVAVAAGVTTPDKDFVLATGGVISGTITSASGGSPIAGVSVTAYNAAGTRITSATTNASGVYQTTTGLATGRYYLATSNQSGFVDEAYNDVICIGCPAMTGSTVSVTQGVTTPNVNFALAPGARVSGTITDAVTGEPLMGISVRINSETGGSAVASARTNVSGTFLTTTGLITGLYYVRTTSTTGYIDEAYDNVPCNDCAAGTGVPVSLTTGVTTPNINFALSGGGRIAGTITNESTGNPIEGASVSVYTESGSTVSSPVLTDAAGHYITPPMWSSGNYRVRASKPGFVGEAYNNTTCLSCSTVTGAMVQVAAGVTTPNIDFALAAGGSIAGTVTDAVTSLPIPGATARLYTESGSSLLSANTSFDGAFLLAGLPTGAYHLVVEANGYLAEAYPDLACVACGGSAGQVINVVAGTATQGIDVALSAGGRISGTVTDAQSSAPLSQVTVRVHLPNGIFVTSATTNELGAYVTPIGLLAGTYHLQTTNSQGYVNEAYDNVVCLGCAAASGAAVTVVAGATTTGINFALARGARFTGVVTAAQGGAGLGNVTVAVHGANGAEVARATSSASGVYITPGVPAGTYRLRTLNLSGYLDEAYNDAQCPGCSSATLVAGGLPVTVAAGALTSGINFALARGGRISGTITDAATGVPLSSVSISVTDATGRYVSSTNTNALGVYLLGAGLPDGDYRLRTGNSQGYLDEAYGGLVCEPTCPSTTGTLVHVTAGATTTGIDFALATGGSITGTVVDAQTGQPLSGVRVGYAASNGGVVFGAPTNTSGVYTLAALPTGSYQLRSSNEAGYIDEAYDNIACVACVRILGAPVTVVAGSTTTGIDFRLARGGGIAGTVTDAVGQPIPSVTVRVYTATGNFVTSGVTGSTGTYRTAGGLAAGKYRLLTSNDSGFVNQIYPDVPLPMLIAVTDLAAGSMVTVADGTITNGIDFALSAGGRISGRLTDSATGAPLSQTSAAVYSATGALVTRYSGSSSGDYLTPALLPGNYRVITSNSAGYTDEAYDNVPCAGCDAASTGSLVTTTAGATSTGISFALSAGGGIRGSVTDGATGLPLESVKVQVHASTGALIGTATTDEFGEFATTFGLPAGQYRLRTANTLGYLDEAFDNVACLGCAMATAGSLVSVTGTAVTSGIAFALSGGAPVSGVITDAATGVPLPNIGVEIYQGATLLLTVMSDAAGSYTSGAGLPPGTYTVRTVNAWGYGDPVANAQQVVARADLRRLAALTGDAVIQVTGVTPVEVNFGLADPARQPTAGDSDADGLPDAFETAYGLDPTSAVGNNGADGADADDDGRTNAQEFENGTHPRGFAQSYFAEGATGNFFNLQLALLNTDPATLGHVQVRYLLPSPQAPVIQTFPLAPTTRKTVVVNEVPGVETAEMSMVIESDVPFVSDRTLSWAGAAGYGAHAETAVLAPSLTWYLAEGATHSGFNLFYLLQNPNTQRADVRVRFLRPSGAPLEKTYQLDPNSRNNIWVNEEDFAGLGKALASTDVSAVFEVLNGQPIIVERALYLDKPGQTFAAGHESAGVTAPSTDWFLAEGNTGPYFDLFVLVANPGNTAAAITATYRLRDGTVITVPHDVSANSRFNIWVDLEDPRLADEAVSTTIHSSVPVIVERALWWPGDFSTWYEAHNSPGATATGTKWALAEGEVGGTRGAATYILLANTSSHDGLVTVTLYFEDGVFAAKTFTVLANSRFNVDVGAEFPAASGRRFGAIVEAAAPNPVQLVVERAMYWDAAGQWWAAGTNALGKRLQ